MVGLPVRDGGLALLNVTKLADSQYTSSQKSTAVLQSLILDQVRTLDPNQRDAHMAHFAAAAAARRQDNVNKTKAEASALEEGTAILQDGSPQLPSTMRRALARARDCQKRGAGLIYTLLPSKLLGLTLDSVAFRDSIAVRYNYPTLHAAVETCTADRCGEPYTLEHALQCRYGGNIIQRHNAPLRALQEIVQTALGDPYNTRGTVKWSPVVRSKVEADALNARARDNNPQGDRIRLATELKGDLAIKGLIQLGAGILIIDGRCFFPDGQSAQQKTAEELLAHHENEKRDKYQAACAVKHLSFIPAVWTTCGAKGNAFIKLVSLLSERLAERWGRPKGRCKAWINGRLAIAFAKATSACIRNLRGSLSEAANDMPLYDGAAIAGGVIRF